MCITSESKLDARTKFERWATMVQNGKGRTIKLVMFDNAKELVAGRMRGFCEQQGIQIILFMSLTTRATYLEPNNVGCLTAFCSKFTITPIASENIIISFLYSRYYFMLL
jgi:hypothetical protein